MRIRRLGVVGAGTMGSGIAALAASTGISVTLLDIPGREGDRNGPAKQGFDRVRKLRPPALMAPERAALVRFGNTEDDLHLLADCDLVLEAIVEQLEPKKKLYESLERLVNGEAIIASNTSGIPMRLLTEERSDAFRSRFLGMHFFNPPRYLHLLELIPTPATLSETLHGARAFSDSVLGKGVVLAKDVPGFVANRLGVFGMVLAVQLMERYELTIDEVDLLTGPLLGRAKSATFRTADLTGIDVLTHVVDELGQATGEPFTLPDWVRALASSGRLGEKSGAGFYRRAGKDIQTLDWRTLEYRPQQQVDAPELRRAGKQPLPERLKATLTLEGKYGDFAREYLLRLSHYVLERTPEVAYDLVSVDRALEWGFAWEAGPFKQMDMLGLDRLRDGLRRLSLGEPELLTLAQRGGSFYDVAGATERFLSFDGTYLPVPQLPGALSLSALRRSGGVLEETAEATLYDAGDGVAVLEFHSKMNTLGEGVLRMLQRSLERVERDRLAGLVIGNEDPRTFSAGADLSFIASIVRQGNWQAIDKAVRAFQDCSVALRSAPFPVVSAPFGLTLGGGCEFTLHADRVQGHAELYMGLVEVGVGLIPAGGGTKELLFRFSSELAPYEEADPFEAIKRAFRLIAMATTSSSALDARRIGYLRDRDGITMNRDRLLADAKRAVLAIADGYVAPPQRTLVALGKEALGNLHYAAWAMHEGGYASDHDVRIAHELAYVLCGGDGPPRTVTEQDVLDLEREAFLTLLGTKETQERIAHMLETGKPLRN